MNTKVCFKCGKELPITEFYKHPQTADGYLNKCKSCTKKDVHENYEKNIVSPDYVEKERERGRDKYKRLYAGVHAPQRHMSNKKTRAKLIKLGYDLTGFEVHHWNYNHSMDVFLLTPRQHKKVHSFFTFNKESQCFQYGDKILTTRDDHREAILSILKVQEVIEIRL